MKIEKKTLAREIIILLSTLGLILLFFVGTEIYNWIFNVKIDNRDKSISAINSEISLNNHLIDSLKYSDDPFNREELQHTSQLATDPPPSRYLWVKMQRDGYDATYDRFREVFSDAAKRDELYSDLIKSKQYTRSKDDFMNQYFTDIPLKNKGIASSPTSVTEPLRMLWAIIGAKNHDFQVGFLAPKQQVRGPSRPQS